MEFELKLFDETLLRFSGSPDSAQADIRITWFDRDRVELLPKGMEPTEESLWNWIRHRSIPQNRMFVNTLLSRCGLSVNRPLGVIVACKGLSLNDSYWVPDAAVEGGFDRYNLYENGISRALSLLAFTGYGSSPHGVLSSSPEFTTGGMLPKRWSRESGKILLYKGGTAGAANAGFEPYSEMYAFQVAKAMGISAIEYWISKRHGVLSSVCELFTSKEMSFVSTGRMVGSGGFESVCSFYEQLGDEFERSLREMVVLDAVICNTDRHYGNFGFLLDARTNEIVAPAPLFDHGNSLFHQAFGQDWDNLDSLSLYVSSLRPRVYDDFVDAARRCMDGKLRAQVRRLLDFSFEPGGRYQLPRKRRELMERQIRMRARILLD